MVHPPSINDSIHIQRSSFSTSLQQKCLFWQYDYVAHSINVEAHHGDGRSVNAWG